MPLKKTARKTTTKRKRIFSDQSRLQADARMISKGINTLYQGKNGINPNERYGVSENQIKLKRSLRAQVRSKFSSTKETFKTTKNPLKIINTFIREKNIGEYKNGPMTDEIMEKRDNGKIRITKKSGRYYKNRKSYRPALLHEFFHSTHLPPNSAGAHAFENYIESRLNKTQTKRKPKEIVNRAIALEVLLKKFNKMKLDEYEVVEGTTLSSVGTEIGKIANDIEVQTGKKGAGLFFLREMLTGKTATFTISRISKGELDKEINEWLKMNPRLARLL